jgi:hypothetical protein
MILSCYVLQMAFSCGLISGVMRNHEGEFLCIFSCSAGNINSDEAKVLSVQKALFFSTYWSYASSNQWVEKSDSYNFIIWIKYENIMRL